MALAQSIGDGANTVDAGCCLGVNGSAQSAMREAAAEYLLLRCRCGQRGGGVGVLGVSGVVKSSV